MNSKQQAVNQERQDILEGLTSEQKYINPKYFYDHRGSKLFEKITELEEYYPTRTELTILQKHAHDIAQYIQKTH